MELPTWLLQGLSLAVIGLIVTALGAYGLRVERHISDGHKLRSKVSAELAKIHLIRIEIQRKVDEANINVLSTGEDVTALRLEVEHVKGRLEAMDDLLRRR